MKKHAQQQYARGSMYNYRSDADDSIPESGINPWDMNKNVRSIQDITKGYYKNFSTGFDGWTNGGMAPGYAVSNKQKLCDDQLIMDPAQNPNRNKMDSTTQLSNQTKIGWRRTTDHRFNIAKYGRKNLGKAVDKENWYKNRANAGIDHDILVSWKDNNLNKTTALLMMDLSQKKNDAHKIGLNNIDWGKSKNGKNNQIKLTPKDMAGMKKRPTKESQDETAHSQLKSEVTTKSGEHILLHDAPIIGKTKIHSTVFEKMGLVNKQLTKQQKSDLRDSIKHSASNSNLYNETVNKKQKNNVNDTKMKWQSNAIFKKGEEKTIMNYKKAKKDVKGNNLQKINKHQFKTDSFVGNQRRGEINTKVIHGKNVKIDNKFGREGVKTRNVGGMGSKYMNSYIKHDNLENEVNDN